MEAPLPEDLVDYVARETGLDRDTVVRVLRAERRYYLLLIYGDEFSKV